MKRFLLFSVSVLCLAIAVLIGFYIGSNKAEAQNQVELIGYAIYARDANITDHLAILSNGDVYARAAHVGNIRAGLFGDPAYCGNILDGVISTSQSTWGDIKNLKK